MCDNIRTSLQHILSGFKVTLTHGCFRWHHEQVLTKLAKVLESCRVAAIAQPALIAFVKPGSTFQAPAQRRNIMLTPNKEWQMVADLRRPLVFPREIIITTLQPDIVMWSAGEKRVLLVEFTIPWEGGMTKGSTSSTPSWQQSAKRLA